MIDYSKNAAYYGKSVPLTKVFDSESIELFDIAELIWLMSIKPAVRNVKSYVKDRVRLEEIEVLSLHINSMPDTEGYYRLLKQIHSQIRYPCVVFLEYKNKYKVVAWSFVDSVSSVDHNILRSKYETSWIYDPPCSERTKKCVTQLAAILLDGEGCIKELYEQVCRIIGNCYPQYIGSRQHLSRLAYDLSGKKNHPVLNSVDCYKKYEVKNPNAKFEKKEYGSSYKYVYEYEDIWYSFLQDEQLKRVIENRRYRDMEDLVFSIDLKYEESY